MTELRVVYRAEQLGHAPQREFNEGSFVEAFERAERLERIVTALGACDNTIELERLQDTIDRGALDRVLRRVHDEAYLDFLSTVWDEWSDARTSDEALPFVWPLAKPPGSRRPESLDGRLGYYAGDAGTPIVSRTLEAALASADTARASADYALARGRSFGLCRPPGHHAGRASFCGYCYLNNAAVAVETLRANGLERIALLDVDYHHGNGSQEIFAERADVFFASLHADPSHEYPYYSGYASEIGEGAGRGSTFNLPLPLDCDAEHWFSALEMGFERVADFSPQGVVVSIGFDTYAEDPLGGLGLAIDDFERLGRRLDDEFAGTPLVAVLEGGYELGTLGDLAASFVSGLSGAGCGAG